MFRKSLFFMEKEKLSVLIKELKQPYLISDYYYSNKNEPSEKKDLEHDFSLLSEEICIVKKRVENNFENLNKQMKIMENTKGVYEIQSLIYLDILRKYIAYEIHNIGKINKKIFQLLRDGYNQYLPKPILGKRFSSVNITSQVESSLSRRLEEISSSKQESNDSLIVWDYSEDYKIVNKEKYTNFYLSYWYFEFSYFLPNLTHELGHKLLNNTKYKEENNKLKKYIDYLVKTEVSLPNTNVKYINSLSDEIFADIIAFSYHGSSFFYALTHQLMANDLSNMFKSIEDNTYDNNYKIIDTQNINIETSFDFWSKYKFTEKKDFVFIRLAILLAIEKEIISTHEEPNIVEKFSIKNRGEIKRLLNSIYNLENINFDTTTLSDLETIFNYDYANESNRLGYIQTSKAVKIIYNGIKKYLLEDNNFLINSINNEKMEDKSEYEEISLHFNDIWNKRFRGLIGNSQKSVHRFEFRKKLHKNTLIKLIKEEILSIENLRPYNMVFLKYKLESTKNVYTDDLEINFCDDTSNKSTEQGIVLGIYDYVYLRELDNQYSIEDIKEFKYAKYNENNIRYYESGYSLMKIMNDTIGESENKSHQINAIIQIEITKTLQNRGDIYEKLFEDLISIKNIVEIELTKHISEYTKIEYFKSLGPKDITIHIDSASINFIFKLKKELATKFKRTFTTFYINNNKSDKTIDSYKKIISSNKYIFISNLRMHPTYNHDFFIELCRNNKNIEKVSHTTGVMDFKIIWKSNISFRDVTNFYSRLTSKKNTIEDIQTSIDKNINLHFCSCEIC